MKNSRRLLSILLVVALCFSTVIISSFATSSADDRTLAFAFVQDDYDKSLQGNDPTTCLCSNDGSVRIASDHNAHQYQVMFRVSDLNSQRLGDAITEACEYYTGQLTVQVTVNSAKTIYGTNCRPSVLVTILGGKADGSPDYNNVIGTTGENQQAVEIPVNYYLDVSQYALKPYNNDAKFVYLQVQCYDWGCGGGNGTTPDVTFNPFYVDDGGEIVTSLSTTKPDPNQTTFFKFSPNAKNDFGNGPTDIMYSSDGGNWKFPGVATEEYHGYGYFAQRGLVEQMQVNYNFNSYQEETINALNLANSDQGNGLLKVSIYLNQCKDAYGNDCPAEVTVGIDTQAGALGEAPEVPEIVAWQYPGTTRNYYLDVSKVRHISQLKSITFRAQNYWYYDENHNLFDYDQESHYAGEEAGMELGYKKCRVKPTMTVSPVTVVKEPGVTYTNTAYDLVLNDFNKNGGYIPNPITLVDPNNPDSSPAPSNGNGNGGSTNGGGNIGKTTVATTPATPVIKSVTLISKKSAKVSWAAAKNATHYEVYRAVGNNKSASFKYFKTVSKNELSIADTTIKGGQKYYYKVRAVNNSSGSKLVSAYSAVKGVKVINYTAKPKIKLTAGAKKLTVKVTKKVTNASKYQVKYSLKKNMKSAKTTTVKTKKTIKKLKAKSTYYVRVRAMTKVNGKNAYGKWSKIAKVTVK